VKLLGIQLGNLIKHFNSDSVIFLGENEGAWLRKYNDYKPVKQALQYFSDKKLGKRYNSPPAGYLFCR
jgi:hypothetical protein